jgi:hypothetical protein
MDKFLIKRIETEKKFADTLYKNFVSKRYGMEPCCILDLEDVTIKKELCDWNELESQVISLSDAQASKLSILGCEIPTNNGSMLSWTSADIQPLIDRISTLENAIDETDLNYIYTRAIDDISSIWSITHDLGKNPSVRIEDLDGNDIIAEIDYVDTNTLTIIFAIPLAGTAYLN